MIEHRTSGTASRSRVLVFGIIGLAVAISVVARMYVASGDDHDALARVDCNRMKPTIAEIQGVRVELDSDRVCAAMHTLASATPIARGFEDDPSDPWHYIGRVRLQPERSAWFLVIVARRSTGFHPEISLRNRRGAGWAIVGQFDGETVLEQLGLVERIDRAKLMSPSSREPRDQRQAL